MAATQKATLFAPDINCGHCQQHINQDLGKLAGIGAVSASPQTKIVEVEYDPDQVSLESIKSVLWAAGYPAKEVSADAPKAAITL
jgi:copper chaperone CopZ